MRGVGEDAGLPGVTDVASCGASVEALPAPPNVSLRAGEGGSVYTVILDREVWL